MMKKVLLLLPFGYIYKMNPLQRQGGGVRCLGDLDSSTPDNQSGRGGCSTRRVCAVR
jgi:hypothetical protein